MQIIFLNTWEGKVKQPIEQFIGENVPSTDVFCLQEVSGDIVQLCERLLDNYTPESFYKRINTINEHTQATYVHTGWEVLRQEALLKEEPGIGLALFTQIRQNDQVMNICNVHGIAMPGDKLDTPGRIKQSQIIINYLDQYDGLKIIGGDFNLDMNSQSVRMFEEKSYRNLVKEFEIPTTRNRLIWDRFPESKQCFSDYVFVSPDINVKEFTVPNTEISDHLPLILEIQIND